MRFFDNLCETVVRALGLSAFTPWGDQSGTQQPLGGNTQDGIELPRGPRFKLPNSQITCDYSAMKGYKFVGGSQTGPVGSWLEPPDKKHPRFDIFTDYESIAPQGVTRFVGIPAAYDDEEICGRLAESNISQYQLDLVNGTATRHEINADGKPMTDSKLFNSSYPGPWIRE